MTIEVGKSLGHYRLVEKLGEGGMGIVWRARDEELDRDVAIKFLPDEFAGDQQRRTRFEREAKAVAALNHPNIVTIHSVETTHGVHFFTMEMVQGEPLSESIPDDGMSPDRLLELAIPVVDAISAAHERGIVHRDLKPSNIMLARTGEVKILDFGLAKFRKSDRSTSPVRDSATTISHEGLISGTISYMSPEQIRGETTDHRSDLFAIGIILYEMATGHRPFHGDSAVENIASTLKDTVVPVDELKPEMPRGLGRIIDHCLEKDVTLRMQSALDLRHELEQLRRESRSYQEEFGPSIAVLPFADMSPQQDQAYFCDGMAEEIINALSKLGNLRVASRTSAFQFRSATMDSRAIGRRLRVGTLLEGSVRKSGRKLRITVQLIEVDQGYHLWSERYDRELADVFEIQDEIARQVVQALQIQLSSKERGALRETPTSNVQAYDYYLRGREFYFQYGRREIEFALQLFSRAVELDPEFVLAHAGLADCWSYLYLYSEHHDDLREQAELASAKAIELAPDSAQAQASRGVALTLGGDVDGAKEAFESAIRLDPDLFEAHYFYARHSFAQGEANKAIRLYEQAMRVHPEDFQAPLLVAQIYDDLGREVEATETRRRGVALAEAHAKLNPDDARAAYMAANGMVALGQTEKGLRWAERAVQMAPEEPMLLYNVGCIYSLAGRIDEAIECLDRAVTHGLTQSDWFEHDSNLDPLREHPEFEAVMRRLDERST
jgi:non-specific serine/threonine protein kinase